MRSSHGARRLAFALVALGVTSCGGGGGRYRRYDQMAYAPPTATAMAGATPTVLGGDGPTAASGEGYAPILDNPLLTVVDHPLSTFAVDVDTASYANVRRFLEQGALPPADAVRVEELVNYFDYAYPAPPDGQPFSVIAEVGPSPWHADRRLVHIGLQGRVLPAQALPPRNLVFLIDVSGSMSDPSKLPLLRSAFALLVEQLGARDHVAIVVYAGASGVVLPPTAGDDHAAILAALDRLEAGGSTNGADGIAHAYALAAEHFDRAAINRVILATDGDFNVGISDPDELQRLIEAERDRGIALTVLGFGMGNLQDATMERLADHGNGNYAYLDSLAEARKVLVTEAGGTFVTIAKDVKVQVELDPAQVASYRLVGYENRLLRDEDFTDDRKDAGEIGAGHAVTALYEIVPRAGATADATTPLMTVHLRYQHPDAAAGSARVSFTKPDLGPYENRQRVAVGGSIDQERVRSNGSDSLSVPLDVRVVRGETRSIAETSTDFRFAAAVAGFGMLLRGSAHAGATTWRDVAALASGAVDADVHGDRRDFIRLVGLAEKLASGEAGNRAGIAR